MDKHIATLIHLLDDPNGPVLQMSSDELAAINAAIALMRGQSEPSREMLAGLLAAMYYAQWSTYEDKKRIERGIESALRDFDIGLNRFIHTSPKDPADEQ